MAASCRLLVLLLVSTSEFYKNEGMSFFDTYSNNGDIVSQVLSGVLLIQSVLSEKVGNYIHNMTTFFSGLAIGFLNCWQIARHHLQHHHRRMAYSCVWRKKRYKLL